MTTTRYTLHEELPGQDAKPHYLKEDSTLETVHFAVWGRKMAEITTHVGMFSKNSVPNNILFFLEFRPLHNTTTILLKAVHDDVRVLPPKGSFTASGTIDDSQGIPVHRWDSDEGFIFQLRPDDTLAVGHRRYTLVLETVDRVEVASSAQGSTIVDLEGTSVEVEERGIGGEVGGSAAPNAVMVQDSITGTGHSASAVPAPGSHFISATPHEQSFNDERVLETPATLNRYVNPNPDLEAGLVNDTTAGEVFKTEEDSETSTSISNGKEVLAEIRNGSQMDSTEGLKPRASLDLDGTASTKNVIPTDGDGEPEEESNYATASEKCQAPDTAQSAPALDGTPTISIIDAEGLPTSTNADRGDVMGYRAETPNEQHDVSESDERNHDEYASAESMNDVPGDAGESQMSNNTRAGNFLSLIDDGQALTSSIDGSQNNAERDGDSVQGDFKQSQPLDGDIDAGLRSPISPPHFEASAKSDKLQHDTANTLGSSKAVPVKTDKDGEDTETEDEKVEAEADNTIEVKPLIQVVIDQNMNKSVDPVGETTPATRATRKRKTPASEESSSRASKRRRPTVQSEDSAEDSINVIPLPKGGQDSSKSTQWTFPDSSIASEPTPSKKGTRGTRATVPYTGDPPNIVYSNSNIPSKPQLLKFLRSQKAKKVEVVSETGSDFLCVSSGELKKTTKLILSVALGKTVVTDKWVVDSSQAGFLVDPTPYLPSDPAREELWGFNLQAAIERGKEGVQVFEGWTIYLTPSLKKELKDPKELQQIAVAAGAEEVILHGPTKPAKNVSGNSLVLGSSEHDDDAAAGLAKKGWTLYDKEIISLSMLRGTLAIDSDEFKLDAPVSSQKSNGRRKGR